MNLPKLRKIFATIPEELYNELVKRNVINNDFDNWISDAILEKLKKGDRDGSH